MAYELIGKWPFLKENNFVSLPTGFSKQICYLFDKRYSIDLLHEVFMDMSRQQIIYPISLVPKVLK